VLKLLSQATFVLKDSVVAGQILHTGGIGAVCGLEGVAASVATDTNVTSKEDEARLLHWVANHYLTLQLNSKVLFAQSDICHTSG
jgi:urocanate hydratase